MKILIPLIAISVLLTGCLNEKKDKISCSDVKVKELVEDLMIAKSKEDYVDVYMDKMTTIKKSNDPKDEMKEAMAAALIKSMATMMMGEEQKKKIVEKINTEFNNYKFTLNDIRTIKNEKELNRVECQGVVKISLDNNYSVSYNTSYNGQLTDNLEKVYAEIIKSEKSN